MAEEKEEGKGVNLSKRVKVEMLKDLADYGVGTIVEVGVLIRDKWVSEGYAKEADPKAKLVVKRPVVKASTTEAKA